MSDADIARQSNDGDGFIIIAGEGNAEMEVEIQEEDIVASEIAVGDDISGKEEVNVEDIVDLLIGDEEEVEDLEPTENGVDAEPEGDPVSEEVMAEVKVGGVEAGVSLQWPGEEDEVAKEEEEKEEEEVKETEEQEEEKAEEEVVPEEEPAEPEQNGHVEQNVDEYVVVDDRLAGNVAIDVVALGDDNEDGDDRLAGNVVINVALVEKDVNKDEREAEPTDNTAIVANVPTGLALSDRIRAYEKNKDDETLTEGDRASMEIASTQAQTTESTPVIRDDLIRASDQQEEESVTPGATKSIREQFNKGAVSNVEIKRTIDDEKVSIRSLENFEPPPNDDDDFDGHIKPQDIIDNERDQGQTAESEPQLREDVVRANDDQEEVCSGTGLKDLKSMFEKGGVSNVQTRVERAKIEIKSLEDVEDGTAHAVAENVPQDRLPDVVSGSTQSEDPGIKSGLAQRIKAQFEKGNVSNIEEKPKHDLEREPKRLDDFTGDDSSQNYSESTPQRREDVVRSDVPLEEQAHAAEGTRSLLSRWEKGQVEHAEEKPGEVIKDAKDLRADMQFAESEPQVRGDLARETDETDEAIPEGAAKNISQSIESGAVSGKESSPVVSVQIDVATDDIPPIVVTEGEMTMEVTTDVESEPPKRLSEGDDEEEQQEVVEEEQQLDKFVEVNGNVSLLENGHGDSDETVTPNGHYENNADAVEVDASAEIKASRTAVVDEEGDQTTVLVESR